MPTEAYLFIFLLACAMIFAFFYAGRVKNRGRVRMTKVHPSGDKPPDSPAH